MRIRILTAFCALAFAAVLPSGLAAQSSEPIKIPVVLSLTGLAAFIGKGEQTALGFLEEHVNKAGGIKGRQVQFVITDDGSNPQTAVQLVNQIIATKVPIMIGPGLTQDCNAVGPLVKDGPTEYCMSPGINPSRDGWIFSSGVSLRDDALVMIRYFRERGLKRMAILSSTDATGQEVDRDYDYVKSLPEFKDIEFVAREHFNLTDVSVSAQLARIKAANPQVLLTWTVGPAFGTELHGITDAGLNVPVGASNGDMIYQQLAQYKSFFPKEVDFVGVLATANDALGTGPIKDAQKVYFDAFNAGGVKPDFVNTLAWDPALIVLDAYRHLPANATAAQFREYITKLHGFAGINGIYDFRDGSMRGISANSAIMQRYNPETGTFTTVSKRGGYVK